VTALDDGLRRLAGDFAALHVRWALIGGLAVSARAEPRTTRDIDVAVAVGDDPAAEQVVLGLRQLGYADSGQALEHDVTGRLATMRMVAPAGPEADVVVDLMFASSGVEAEVVDAASPVELLPGLTVFVASTGHLLALKTLAGRLQDAADFVALFRTASAADLDQARHALALMTERRTHRAKDLAAEFERLCAVAERER
jgi:hypothetical protein